MTAQTMTIRNSWSGWSAMFLGVVTMSASWWADTTPVGAGLTLGFGALVTIYAAWSLIARDPTKDHWALSVVGLALFIAPWVGLFASDGAAWTAWICGALIMLVGGGAYLSDESANVTEQVQVHNRASYEASIR
ncbi:SPW repeat protein [Rhodococcus sp. ZPP]|uniref:SPW repeat domain-containing protein n=1 Tax=Rhodococcus sp. ZPP TaxID=2749906 RepID=UPI001FCD7A2C|nr:SPW repeat protein [Rhodococcus sp. ZPP]